MQILLNELSLTGQFHNTDDFFQKGILPFVAILKEMHGVSTILLKKSDVWDNKITPSETLHTLLIKKPFRNKDEVRRLKSALAELTKEPFWDSDSKQSPDTSYQLNGSSIFGSSPAEACERDQTIISFVLSKTSTDPLNIIRDGINIQLLNLTYSGRLTEHLWTKNLISFVSFLKTKFSGGKLNFSRLNEKLGFPSIQNDEQSLFIETFQKFEMLSWDQIIKDKGLNYKLYNSNIDDSYKGIKTYKFRVSLKFRCHGYREKDSFFVIGIETDHKLSNKG